MLTLLSAVLLAACGPENGGTRVTREDSAGVQIVQNTAPDSGTTRWWTLAAQPELSVGAVEGTESDVLFSVVAAARLTDGRVVIANAGHSQVRYYAPDGKHLLTSGRKGGGPGEFQRITGLVRLPADSIAVLDGGARRVTVLAPDGRFARVVLAAAGERATVVAQRADGAWVAQVNSPPANNAVASGRIRSNVSYVTLPAGGGAVTDTLGVFPGIERVIQVRESNGAIASVDILTPPFAKATTFVTLGNDLVVGTQDAAEVRVYNADGVLRRIVRTGTPERRLTPALIDQYLQRRVARLPRERQQAMRENQRALITAEVVPSYGTLAVDRSGNLWLQDYPGLAADQRWTIFAEDGARIARIVLPARFTPYDIGDDWILGREQDDVDVEYVRVYAIRRSAP